MDALESARPPKKCSVARATVFESTAGQKHLQRCRGVLITGAAEHSEMKNASKLAQLGYCYEDNFHLKKHI